MAGGGKLKLRGRTSSPAPPVDLTVSMLQTESQFVDLSAFLNQIPQENDITATVSGVIPLKVWPFMDSAYTQSSGSMVWCRRELMTFGPGACRTSATTSATPAGTGVGTWTFAAKNGANETGSTVTYVVSFDVTTLPRLSFEIGDLNRAQSGGYDLTSATHNNQLPSATDWTVTAQTNSGQFGVVGTPGTSWYRIAPLGTYNGNPTVALTPGTVSITINSATLGQSYVLTATIHANRKYVCPTTNVTATSQAHAALSAAWTLGQHIVLGPGTYPTGNITLSATAPANYGSNTYQPVTQPYNEGWEPLGLVTANDAWVHCYSQVPQGVAFNNVSGTSALFGSIACNRAATGGFPQSYFGLRFAGIRGAFNPTVSTAQVGLKWIMMDHCFPQLDTGGGVTWNNQSDYSIGLFMCDNYALGNGSTSTGNLLINGRDSHMCGNIGDSTSRADFSNGWMYNVAVGNGHASGFWWTFTKNWKCYGQAHLDGVQVSIAWAVAGQSLYGDLPAGSTVEFDVIGTQQTLGIPSFGTSGADTGKAYSGAEMYNIGTGTSPASRIDLLHKMRIVGNVMNDIGFWMFTTPPMADGSILTQNANYYDAGIIQCVVTGSGYAPLGPASGTGTLFINYTDGAPPSPTGLICKRNINLNRAWNSFGGLPAEFMSNITSANAVVEDNWQPAFGISTSGDLANYTATFANPTIGNQAQTVGLLYDAMTPLPGTQPLLYAIPAGPYQPKSSRIIDHRRRTYSNVVFT